MSMVAVHGPHTMYSTSMAEAGPANAVATPSNGLSWSFSADPSTRPAADYDWTFGSGATPASQADSKGPIAVTYSTAGTKVVTLTIPSAVSTVTNKALTANVATLTVAAAHGLIVGDSVVVASVGAPFDGTYTVTGVPSATTFSYVKTNADVTSGAATGTVTWPGRPAAGAYVMGIQAKTGAIA
jgi:hypothetical protein